MGMGSAFNSGMAQGRSLIHHLDIGKQLGGGRTPVSVPTPAAGGLSRTEQDAAEMQEQSRYREKMGMAQQKLDSETGSRAQADQLARGKMDIEKQNATLNRDKMWQEQGQKESAFQMTEDQHRRMQGFQKAIMGLHGRDTQLMQDGWAELLPGGGALQETKGKDGKTTIEQIIPRFSFNGDGSIDIEMPGGEKARASSAQEVYKMLLAPLSPALEKPKGTRGGPGFYDKEEYKSLLEEQRGLQKTIRERIDDGRETKDLSSMNRRLKDVKDRLAAMSGGGGEPASLKYTRAPIADPGDKKPKATPEGVAAKFSDGNWHLSPKTGTYVRHDGKGWIDSGKKTDPAEVDASPPAQPVPDRAQTANRGTRTPMAGRRPEPEIRQVPEQGDGAGWGEASASTGEQGSQGKDIPLDAMGFLKYMNEGGDPDAVRKGIVEPIKRSAMAVKGAADDLIDNGAWRKGANALGGAMFSAVDSVKDGMKEEYRSAAEQLAENMKGSNTFVDFYEKAKADPEVLEEYNAETAGGQEISFRDWLKAKAGAPRAPYKKPDIIQGRDSKGRPQRFPD